MTGPKPFIHSHALVESEDIGEGTRIWAFAHVMKGAKVGSDCNVGDHAFLESGTVLGDRVTVKNSVLIWEQVTIEDEVFLGPNVVFTNDRVPRVAHRTPAEQFEQTRVARGASIGAHATIVCGVTIGRNAMVGAGAVVTKDVKAHALVYGNPATQHGWVCACGHRLPEELECSCGRRYVLRAGDLIAHDVG